MKNRILSPILMVLMALPSTVIWPSAVQAQVVVYDPSNYVQSVLQATRALQQISNQIRGLQNQAIMLQNMAKNLKKFDLSALAGINRDLVAIDALMKEAKGIAFTLEATREAFRAQFPGHYDGSLKTIDLLSGAETRWRAAMNAYGQTLDVQAKVSENLAEDAQVLNRIVAGGEASEGSLEAQQAANQLLALTAKQQMQIQTLLAAQYRAEALDAARKAEAEAVAKATTRRFLGSGKGNAQ